MINFTDLKLLLIDRAEILRKIRAEKTKNSGKIIGKAHVDSYSCGFCGLVFYKTYGGIGLPRKKYANRNYI
jgi:hypothetical protein